MFVLPSWNLVRRAADDYFIICRNTLYEQVFMLPRWRLIRPTADDDFVISL